MTPAKYRHPMGTWAVAYRGETYYEANEDDADARMTSLASRRHCDCGCPLHDHDGERCAYCRHRHGGADR